jgi:23S rRNA (cytidine1920-2'-O)/16S rRNA (cytidine1409-2'-O)-methyltransferase
VTSGQLHTNSIRVIRKPKPARKRLDALLVERGLADTAAMAQAMILAGEILVNGQRSDKAGTLVSSDAQIVVSGLAPKYASRGGLKLEGALADFGIAVRDRVCLDIGASTGGFTDCLLQHGAARVFAVDVTPEQLLWRLQRDPRVTSVKANARNLVPGEIAGNPDLVTVDVSFISVAAILAAIVVVAGPSAEYLILVKPQFELPREDVAAGGVVRDSMLHQRAIDRVKSAAQAAGLVFAAQGDAVHPSRITGAEGNQEYFLHCVGPLAATGSGELGKT